MVRIEVQGPDHAGKGLVMAAIARALSAYGCLVTVQSETTHNKPKMELSDMDLADRLKDREVVVMELHTSL